MIGNCELCKRENELTFHHLIPRTNHKNKWFKKNFTREEMNQGINICNMIATLKFIRLSTKKRWVGVSIQLRNL